MRRIHLICNAHLDPVWLWRKEEGMAEALSTFRIAAELCEKYDVLLFNHNEAVLYQWVQAYDAGLFQRIQKLVKEGKWHIMGGWYLQPDCNMPSGEAMVRQVLEGRRYFMEFFGVYPTTAINFDPFGHSQGLVQILRKSGYDSYIFGRPFEAKFHLPDEDFIWIGLDGSRINANRAFENYVTLKGEATKKIGRWIEKSAEDSLGLVLWGIGNHGGGPSEIDVNSIDALMQTSEDEVFHSTPEAYFSELEASGKERAAVSASLRPWAIGCYTSQVRIKQKYREIENQYFYTEKMATLAYVSGIAAYPEKQLQEARTDMLFCQFHDILPGSAVKSVEDDALRMMDHGLEILYGIRTKLFFQMSMSFPAGDENHLPVLVYNPHPYKTESIVECEFVLANQNWKDTITIPTIYNDNDEIVASQLEKEDSNLTLDWHKKVAFEAELKPLSVNRFYCTFKETGPATAAASDYGDVYTFSNNRLSVEMDTRTGFINKVTVHDIEYVNDSIRFQVMDDTADSWCENFSRFNTEIGAFILVANKEGSLLSGIRDKVLPSFRIIESGAVRTVVECIYAYNNSSMVVHYKLPQNGTEIEMDIRVFWNEKDKMIKLAIPVAGIENEYRGQTMFGYEVLESNGREAVAQKWTGAFSASDDKAVTVINQGTYGSDFSNKAIHITLLRSAAYSALTIGDRPLIRDDRFADRMEQGERRFRFWLNFGNAQSRIRNVDREALLHNQEPYALSFYPKGGVRQQYASVQLTNNIELSAFKKAEKSDDVVLRMFNPMRQENQTTLQLAGISKKDFHIQFAPFEVKSFIYRIARDEMEETDMMEGLWKSIKASER